MKKLFIIALAGVFSVSLNAQKIKVTSGSLSALAGVKEVGVIFDYSEMRVGKKSEDSYVLEKVAKYNEKEPGRGDQWAKSWTNDREARFEPNFFELINKYGKNWTFSKGKKDVYLKFHTIYTEPGWNIGISRSNAIINAVITVYSGGSEVAEITMIGAAGRTFGGYDFDTGVRISECYALAGKSLGKFLVKKAK